MEELPYAASERTARQFHAALSTFLAEAVHPAVMIYTEENEDRYGEASLEGLLTRTVLQSRAVRQIHVNPVTDGELYLYIHTVKGDRELVKYNEMK